MPDIYRSGVQVLEGLPAVAEALGHDLTVDADRAEKTEQGAPLQTLKGDRLFRICAVEDPCVVHPAEIRSVQVAVADLKLGPVRHALFVSGLGDLLVVANLAQQLGAVAEADQHQPVRPEKAQGVDRHNPQQGNDHQQG